MRRWKSLWRIGGAAIRRCPIIKGVLDTDILSEIGKGLNQIVLKNTADHLIEHGRLTFTSISVYEQLYGFKIKGATRREQEFLSLIAPHQQIVPTTTDPRLAATIRAAMQLAGTTIGSHDPIIAACAITRDLPLITGNTRDSRLYPRRRFRFAPYQLARAKRC